ncbi:flavin-containing monooxygenase [Gordonia rubripertincta]|uniref:NAD(P)/FAD-dependent oxidoreductase n=1 Tax=Gordonia rubripertincta TaxID=36822 RepID=A0ABT4N3B4_GORRU|nr:NAD(P)/FAD-dependent oxidoreductase [Gordonia rubripertincta]MCZ4553712.1 NAD(P)/FAD-dependent oxidoreductase [Gordonia rubripertincta]
MPSSNTKRAARAATATDPGTTEPITTKVLIIGSGFSGLGMAVQLRRSGYSDFIVLEKADSVGGTWRDNTYPGCACDVPSLMYSYSFESRGSWSKVWSSQPEIEQYLKEISNKRGVTQKIHFGQKLVSGYWSESESRWHLRTESGREYIAQYVVSGVGALHIPNYPSIPGIDDFTGQAFHSAKWDHTVDLQGKRVAVIGTGASAIQFVPFVQKEASALTVFQRTPAWVLPRKNFAVPTALRTLLSKIPVTRRLARWSVYWGAESLAFGLNGHSNLMRPIEKVAKWNIERSITDPGLRRKLMPSYRIGCKRILGSNDYYPALAAPNTTVISDRIEKVTADSIVTADGVSHSVDVIIYATGFHVTDGFDQLALKGARGEDLPSHWHETGINTHLGITTEGFPNLFFLLGPNTGLGHNSVVFMIEQQIKYIMKAIDAVDSRGAQRVDVRPEVQEHFNKDIQHKLAKGVWTNGGCTSWYLDSQGVNRTVWPGFTWQYWRATKDFKPTEYEIA